MSNTYQEPMADGADHPLKHCPFIVLAVARAAMQEAVDAHDVASDMADPIADMIVMALMPYIRPAARSALCRCGHSDPRHYVAGHVCSDCGCAHFEVKR